MKLAIIGTVGVPASYGGFETLVEHIIGDDENQYTVYCSGKHYSDRISGYKGAKLVYIPLKANGAMSVIYDLASILHALIYGHRQFLILGTSGAIVIPLLAVLWPSVRTVTNIDGIEWRREKWQGLAKRFLKFSEYLAVKHSTTVVADNQAIADYVRSAYQRQCETIAYGGDHALGHVGDDKAIDNPSLGEPYSFALCRIEPENNVELILEAFVKDKEYLTFIGNWQSSVYGQQLYAKYSSHANLRLLNPIYEIEALSVYRKHCRAYVHGHSAGGTNPSLVEMMHFAKPVVAFDCPYNRATMENKGMYFKTATDLADQISVLKKDHDPVMQEIAQRRYTWATVKKQYLALFD